MSRERHMSGGGLGSPALRAATVAVGILAAVLAFAAPPDAVQGEAQRLMYVHVPAAWSAYLCFAAVLVASIVFLRTRSARAAAVARAAGQVGLVLTALTLASGMVWGALAWGTAWVWDGRTTSTVAMGLIYVIYLAARAAAHGRRSRTAAAWVGVLGFVSVPVVHMSVVWWRTLHQSATVLNGQGAPPIDAAMAVPLGAAVLTATLVTGQVIVALSRRELASRAGASETASQSSPTRRTTADEWEVT
ncbi:cytochrome c biogenesis protein CcsA [Demequina sp. SO4-13]|uniref:cytochrome c biogenesis protein CcsA n=1 Tax=Demequina sp. SO4-13 TaxID=3401027 RepID=UPI003AF7D60A